MTRITDMLCHAELIHSSSDLQLCGYNARKITTSTQQLLNKV